MKDIHPSRALVAVAVLVALSVALAACGGGSSSSSSSTAEATTENAATNEEGGAETKGGETEEGESAAGITPPSSIASSGTFTICSDLTYPPDDFLEGSTPVGFNIEIGEELAKMMGVEFAVENVGFVGIIAALEASKCDAIIAGSTDTAERREQVDFIDYMNVGGSILVPDGNPAGVKSVDDLSGLEVAVANGTTWEEFLKKESKRLEEEGKGKIDVTSFPRDTESISALRAGQVDAYLADTPPVAYFLETNPGLFEIAGPPVEPAPEGIQIKKNEPELKQALTEGVEKMYSEGSMKRILSKWGLESALES